MVKDVIVYVVVVEEKMVLSKMEFAFMMSPITLMKKLGCTIK